MCVSWTSCKDWIVFEAAGIESFRNRPANLIHCLVKMFEFILWVGRLRVVWFDFSSMRLFDLRIAPLPFALVVCIVVQWNRQVLWNAGAGENVDNWVTTTKLHRQRAVHSHFKWKVSSKMLLMWFVAINTPVPCLPIKVPIAGEMASMVSFNGMMRFGPRQVVGSWDSMRS